jgi:hypothetical protein
MNRKLRQGGRKARASNAITVDKHFSKRFGCPARKRRRKPRNRLRGGGLILTRRPSVPSRKPFHTGTARQLEQLQQKLEKALQQFKLAEAAEHRN